MNTPDHSFCPTDPFHQFTSSRGDFTMHGYRAFQTWDAQEQFRLTPFVPVLDNSTTASALGEPMPSICNAQICNHLAGLAALS